MNPRTKYAKTGQFNIAYQVVGEGPFDLVLSPGWVSHLDLAWDVPPLARFLTRLSALSRLILFDKRGTGLSDRVSPGSLPALEERMDDARAVMDAARSERAVLFGTLGGGAMSGLVADEETKEAWLRLVRSSVSPASARVLYQMGSPWTGRPSCQRSASPLSSSTGPAT